MNKKTLHIVMSVALGIAFFAIVATVISLLFDAILSDDTYTIASLGENAEKVVSYVKHSSIGVICVAIPALVCYCFTYSAKSKKVFGVISVLLSIMLISMCIGFIFDLRGIVLKFDSARADCYTIATSYFTELIQLLASCCFACVYFVVATVLAFRPQKTGVQPTSIEYNDEPASTVMKGE